MMTTIEDFIIQHSKEHSKESFQLDENNIFSYVQDHTTLNDGDCIMVAMCCSRNNNKIIYGRLIKDGFEYKIRYLDPLYSSNAPDEAILHPRNNNYELLIMHNQFSEFINQYKSHKSMEKVKDYFKNKKQTLYIDYDTNELQTYRQGKAPLLYKDVTLIGDNNITIKHASTNMSISITKKTDDEIIGIATDGITIYKYFYLYGTVNVEKIRNLLPITKDIQIYKLDKPIEPPENVFAMKHFAKRFGPFLTKKDKKEKKGGRRRYKRTGTKKNKKHKGKNTRCSL